MEQELCFYMVRRCLDRLHAAGKLVRIVVREDR